MADIEKDIFEFNNSKWNKDVKSGVCKLCANIRGREYYKENREIIRNRYKEYNIYYYQKNKEKIITRVQNNYYLKVGYPKKPEKIIIKNEILDSNIIIRLMD
jgi:hypothetical protein